jgi:transcription antitermination factor NusG
MGRVFCVNTPDAWCETMTLTWYVLRSKPNKEDFFWSQLLAHQIEVYYPCIRAKVVNPRARKLKPYFPGYLFVHVDPKEVTTSFLNWLPGSRGLVAFDSQPASVPDALIAAIRHRVDQINNAGGEQLPGLQPGETVMIQDGPFAGQEAIFESCLSGNERVRVLLKLLRGKQLPVELPGAQIERTRSAKQ